MQWIINHYLSSIRPAPQKMILTIDTCTAAVYVSILFLFLVIYDLQYIGIWLAISATSRCRFSEPVTPVLSIFLRTTQNLNNWKDFSTMLEFLSRRRMDKGLRQSVALSNAPEILFSQRMMVRKVLLRYVFYIFILSLYCIAKSYKAPFPGNV